MVANEKIAEDKVGDDLKLQRFAMLEDIARELAGEVIFPTAFTTTLRVRRELQNPDLSIARIAGVVSVEPLVVAKLIHFANSVVYRRGGLPVRDLSAAIHRLGTEVVRTTALAIAMAQLLRSKEMAPFSDLAQALWAHSVKTAAAARVIARHHTRWNPDEAQLAGLVHDLGAFYMLYRGAQYDELRERPQTLKYLIVSWHESIGVSLLNALGLPDEVVEAATDHDQPRPGGAGPVRSLGDVVYVANALCGGCGEWLAEVSAGEVEAKEALQASFADLLPTIEAETEAMLAVFA